MLAFGHGNIMGCTTVIVTSIAIMTLGGALNTGFGFSGFPEAILIVAVSVICLEKVKRLDFVSAVFADAGVFFGFMSYIKGVTFSGATG